MTPAARLTNEIRLAASAIGARLFPMTVGKFWSGRVVKRLPNGDMILRNARLVNVGTPGMSDLVGFVPHVVTADDVGRTLAVYTGVEVKAGKDRVRSEQQVFIDAVTKNGGRAGIARSPEDAVRIVSGG